MWHLDEWCCRFEPSTDSESPLPRSGPGDTLHQDENGVVWILRADGTPVVAMSERAHERIIGGGNHALD